MILWEIVLSELSALSTSKIAYKINLICALYWINFSSLTSAFRKLKVLDWWAETAARCTHTYTYEHIYVQTQRQHYWRNNFAKTLEKLIFIFQHHFCFCFFSFFNKKLANEHYEYFRHKNGNFWTWGLRAL